MAGGDWVGDNGNTWHRGSGIGRQEVKGPCLLRNDGAFFLLKRNKLGNFLGVPYVKSREYRWGKLIMAVDQDGNVSPTKMAAFQETSTAQEQNWNACNPAHPIDERVGGSNPNPPADEKPFVPAGQYSTPITENIDWRIALAVAIVVIIGIYAAIKLR